MTIYATTFIINGSNNNIPQVYTNNLTPEGVGSNIAINSDLLITGNVIATKKMSFSKTLFGTFRPQSNIAFRGSNELHALSNEPNMFSYDMTSTDLTGIPDMGLQIPYENIFDESNGIIRCPTSGLYHLSMQGAFSNDASKSNLQNGVYYYFPNRSHSNARISACITDANIVSTNMTVFMLSNDQVLPTFYTNDSNAVLMANGETFVAYTFLMGTDPENSNYYRIP